MPTAFERSQDAIDRFADALWIEDGLSPNTLAAYRRDLARYAAFLSARGIDDPAGVADADVSAFLASLQAPTDGHAPLSSASATRTSSAPSMTWLLVTTMPSA